MTLLELSDVSVHYGRIQAVSGLSITVNEGEIVTLIGANGSRQVDHDAGDFRDPAHFWRGYPV